MRNSFMVVIPSAARKLGVVLRELVSDPSDRIPMRNCALIGVV